MITCVPSDSVSVQRGASREGAAGTIALRGGALRAGFAVFGFLEVAAMTRSPMTCAESAAPPETAN
jgi:hypothetical protein